MTAAKKKKTKSEPKSENTAFRFSCCKPEKMLHMMKKFCGGEGKAFDCSAMMEKMCGDTPKPPDPA